MCRVIGLAVIGIAALAWIAAVQIVILCVRVKLGPAVHISFSLWQRHFVAHIELFCWVMVSLGCVWARNREVCALVVPLILPLLLVRNSMVFLDVIAIRSILASADLSNSGRISLAVFGLKRTFVKDNFSFDVWLNFDEQLLLACRVVRCGLIRSLLWRCCLMWQFLELVVMHQ